MDDSNSHYVYAYYDPRNLKMFYIGKGKGSRKDAHKPLKSGSDKESRLHQILRAGEKPLIRVIAANLTDEQAQLIETTLLWHEGELLTNIQSGKYIKKFRDKNTLNQELPALTRPTGCTS